MRSGGRLLPAAALAAVVALAHAALAPKIASVDSFYHVGHSAQYAEHGLLDTSFPWATQSAIGDLGADLWWGFHVVLVPFALAGDVTTAIRAAGAVMTLLLGVTVWWILERHRVRAAGWWAVLFLVATPNVLYRYVMVRPHVLSLALGLLLVSVLARGRWWQALLVSAAITWLHLGLFWMGPGLVAAFSLVRGARAWAGRGDRDPPPAGVPVGVAAVAVLAGTLLGALLRPRPIASLELAWIQIGRLFSARSEGLPLIFAGELAPLPAAELARTSWFFLIAWGCALAVASVAGLRALRRRERAVPPGRPALDPPEVVVLGTCLAVSVVFAALAVLSARRALMELVAFGSLALPLAWTLAGPSTSRRRVGLALAVLLAAHVPWTGWRHLVNRTWVAFPPDLLAESATWLAENTAPGDVVWHGHWDNFGPLFARNRSNRYLGGMDPIFQYAHDPKSYWEHFYLSGDLVVEYTCDAFPCHEGTATGIHDAVGGHTGARWVLVEPARNPKLTQELLANPGFTLAHETPGALVFRVEAGA